MTNLADIVAKLTPEQRAVLELRLQQRQADTGPAPIEPRASEGPAQLSFAQERLWFLDQLHPGTPLYNITAAVRMRGVLDVDALQLSMGDLIRRHEVLRARFVEVEGAVRQVFDGEVFDRQGTDGHVFELPVTDLSRHPSDVGERVAQEQAMHEAQSAFDLSRGPLIRVRLLRLAVDHHLLVLNLHHIIADGGSVSVLIRELGLLYAGYTSEKVTASAVLEPLKIQYADYAAWQRQRLSGEALKRDLEYWRQQLANAPDDSGFPADRPRPATPGIYGARRSRRLETSLEERLKALVKRQEATLFITLLAAFHALLYRYTGQGDLVVGTPIDNRDRPEVEGLVGFFVNTLVIRSMPEGRAPFQQLLRQVREAVIESHRHQKLPFEKLVEDLRPEGATGEHALFRTMFELQGPALGEGLPGLELALEELDTGTAKFDLVFYVRETGAGLVATAEYATELFESATIDRLLGHFDRLLQSAVRDPELALGEMSLMGVSERSQLLEDWNQTRRWDAEASIFERFARQVARDPNAVAVVCDGAELTYRELNELADRLATRLIAHGVGVEDRVALCCERSLELVAAILGILRSGAAYVPLDPSYPRERLDLLIADSRASLLLLGEGLEDRFSATQVTTLGLTGALADGHPGEPLEAGQISPDCLAYIIYTSGSTGRPKGVGISHRNVLRLFDATRQWFDPGPTDVWTLFHSYAFDFSVWEIWGALLHGGRLVVVPREVSRAPEAFAELLISERVTFLNQTPSAFRQLAVVEPPGQLRLKWVIFGGEALDPSILAPWIARHGDLQPSLVNMYGITETTVHVTHRLLSQQDLAESGRSPIGRRIPDLRLSLVGPEGSLTPHGGIGEVRVGGAGLARGYLGRSRLTAERFVPDPWSDEAGGRSYRSGDLARSSNRDELEYVGRLDQQVKVRGFRIELGEVAAVLEGHPDLNHAVVRLRALSGTEHRLVAYVVPRREPAPRGGELRRFLVDRLPEFMVPSAFVSLAELPLTANGKLDESALPEPETSVSSRFVPPRTPYEEIVAGCFVELLEVERAGAEDNFFDLGGHSLLAVQLVGRLRQMLGVEVPLQSVFEAATVEAMAAACEQRASDGRASARPIEPAGEGPHPLSFGQRQLWFQQQLEPDNVLYNIAAVLRLQGPLDVDALAGSLSMIVRRHEILRSRFVSGADGPEQILGGEIGPLSVIDLGRLPSSRRRELARTIAQSEARRAFDLASDGPLRVSLSRLNEREHHLAVTLHHIAGDGWSIGLLLDELSHLYPALAAGDSPRLVVPALQFTDYATWQRATWRESEAEPVLDYWRGQLADRRRLELPAERHGSAGSRHRGASLNFELAADLVAELEALGRQNQCTLFMVLLAAFQSLLSRWTSQSDITVGTPMAGRDKPETESLIGFFVDTLVLRTDVSRDPTFTELLRRTRRTALAAYSHRIPIEKLVEDLQPGERDGENPLYEVFFALQTAARSKVTMPGLEVELERVDRGTSTHDLALTLVPGSNGLQAMLEYRTELFQQATAERFAAHFSNLLTAAVANPDLRLSRLPMLAPSERCQLVDERRRQQPVEAVVGSVCDQFERQAAEQPDAVALESAGQRLSYGELNRRANRVAYRLIELGVGPESRVAVSQPRTFELIVAILGIVKAGGVYVPIDPKHPEDRQAYVIQDCGAKIWLADQPPSVAGVEVLVPSQIEPGSQDETNPQRQTTSANAIYVIYTSGSTGRPKGVVVTHASVERLFTVTHDHFGFSARDTWVLFHSHAFDFSVWEMWGALRYGGQLVIAGHWLTRSPTALLDELLEQRVTVLNQTPSAFRQLMAASAAWPGVLRSLKWVIFGGEALDFRSLRSWIERYGVESPRLINMYGITETTVHTTYRPVAEGETLLESADSWIGAPLQDLGITLVGRNAELMPQSTLGEMWISGRGLARGYLDRPGLTAERFVPDLWGEAPGERCYRSGDLGRRSTSEELVYGGRLDHQVQIRGFRIELGEIEASLSSHPEVRQAVVLNHLREQDTRLAAFIIPGDAPSRDGLVADLRRHLATRLPDYMVPADWLILDELPLTSNGKLDRDELLRAIPTSTEERTGLEGQYLAPRTTVESTLAELWSECLGCQQPGVEDNFFELGGHSLVLTQLAVRINEVFGVEVGLRELFDAPTIEKMTVAIASAQLGQLDVDEAERFVEEIRALSASEVQDGLLASAEALIPAGSPSGLLMETQP
ncbi:MAG: amino acid adenylation domain-containing protein [Acidobacteriota bacterium]